MYGGIPEDTNLVPVLRFSSERLAARKCSYNADYNSPIDRLQLISIIEKWYNLLYSVDFAFPSRGFF